ncbi:MAG TPA: TetR/AcrR family transcriptional regulator [Solirubrobacteraceae bacterium]|jgi:AcrR family transcriptional regulator
MIVAAAAAARERGAAAVSVTDVVTRAGVSRRTFYEVFADREECLQSTLEEAIARASAKVLPAWRAERGWREAIRAGLLAFLSFLDEEPRLGVFLIVDALGAGDLVLARRVQVTDSLIDAVDQGRSLARSPQSLSRLAAEGVVGAVLSIVHARLVARSRTDTGTAMTGLLGELLGVVALPYLGPAAAAKEAASPAPAPTCASAPPTTSALSELEIRLTYRTVRVLRAMGELAEDGLAPSNRAIGARAGVDDQGQISKLLSRLARAGLVENAGGGRERGKANAWRLTDRGAQVEQAVRSGRP